MAALTLLNLTIFFLHSDAGDPSDPDPESGNTTAVPGIIAFGISGSIFVLIFAAVMISAIATRAITTMQGFRGLLASMYGSGERREDALMHYMPV